MVDWTNIISDLAIIWTIGLFLCGSEICYKILKKNSTGEISSIPFLFTFFSCVLSFYYGILIKDFTVIVVNVSGFILEGFYIGFYIFFAVNKKKTINQFTLVIIAIAVIAFYELFFEKDVDSAIFSIGYMSCLSGVLMFGSPLVSIRDVIKSRSTESLSFLWCLASFICASLWSIYGFMLEDMFILTPNFIGSILGLVQVSLFKLFPSHSFSSRSKLKAEHMIY